MKKRVGSLLLTLALCLSLLPTAALAEEVQPTLNNGTGTEDVYTVDRDTAAPERIAPLADTASVASVTIGGETTEYSNIFRAFESVEKVHSATIKLLDDVYLPEDEDERFSNFPGKIEFRSSGSVTLDLNGHLLTQKDIGYADDNNGYTPPVIEMIYGTLTITGKGTIHQRYKIAAITVSSQSELTIDSDDVTVKADFTYGSKKFPTDSSRAIAITGGTLEIRGGSFTATSGVALEYTEGTVRLYEGTFNGIKIVTYKYPGKINEGVTIVDLLAPGYTYQNTDGTFPDDFYVQDISDVQVVKGLVPVPYVDADGNAATAVDYIQIEPTITKWEDGKTYVVRGNVTINSDVTVSGKMPSILLCDRASLTVNGGIALPDGEPEALTIYGQTGGTGTMTVTNKSGAAFLSEGLAVLRLLNGTLTATGKDKAFSDVMVWNQLSYGNDEIKCIETGSETETWADGQAVSSVTLSRCTERQWSYAQAEDAEQHLRTCALCLYNPNGAGVYENCVYDTYYGQDESGHREACVCHRAKPSAELVKHTPDYIPNPDGKTHGYRCTDCGFVSGETALPHSYVDGKCSVCGYACPHEGVDRTIGSETEGICSVCGERVYEARLVRDNGKVVEHYETVEGALARYTSVSDSIVTLLCDKDMGDGALVVTYEISGKELDLGGHTLSGSGDAVFQINKRYGFTLHNGTVKNTGDGDAIQLIHGIDPNWGGTISDGELTLENIIVTAAKGWAICVTEDASYADLYIKSGTFNGGLNAGTISGGHKVQIYGGTFIANTDTHSIYYPGSSLTETMLVGRLKDMLAGGWTYGDAEGKAINYFAVENRTIVGKSQYNYPEGVYLNAETVTIVEHTSHPIDRETGKCTICGAPCTHIETDKDGLCTACGTRVMFCEAEGALYKTIQAAQETLKDRTDNPTVKLLADYGDNVSLLGTENGYTLDLNGFRLISSPVIMLEGRTLTIADSSEAKTGGLTEMQISGGTAYLRDGVYAELAVSHGMIKVTGEGTVKITKKIEMPGKFIASGEYSNDLMVADMLLEGYAFYLVDENTGTETLVNGYRNVNGQLQQFLPGPNRDRLTLKDGQYYTVKPHTHSYADSTQTTCECGKTCTHDSVDADGVCAGCGRVFTAKVTDSDGNTVYYADGTFSGGNTRSGMDVAFEKAGAGSTVTLLGGSSVTGWLDGGKTLTLDLNGKTVGSLYIGRAEGINALNITGSGDIDSLYVHADNTAYLADWSGKMDLLYVYDGGKATLFAGTVVRFGGSAGTAGSVLTVGRAFQKEDGSFVEYGAELSTLENVTAVACPDTVIQNGHCIYCNRTVAAMVNGTAYNEFDSAVTAWLESGGTMTLYKSVENMTTATWQGGSGKAYTLDLNGCKLTAPDDDSGSTAPAYQITVTSMDLTVQDTSAAADGQIDNLLLSTNSKLTLKSGWLGKPTVPNDGTVQVTLEGGGLKGYDVKAPLAYVLPDGCYLINEAGQHVSLWGFGTSGNTVTVRRALTGVGGGKTGTMPFGRNLLPFVPSAAPEDGVETPAKVTIAWYKQDGTPLADAEMKLSKTGYVYDSGSEKAAFQAYDGMTISGRYALFAVLTAADETGRELWQAAVTGYELSVGLPTLDDAEIKFTGSSEAVFDPDGTGVPAFTVTLYGETVDAAHYTVTGGTADGVGIYTVTVTGDGTNYIGGTSAKWTVRAYKLGEMELSSTATRKYDGTAAVPGDMFTGAFRSGEGTGTVALATGDYKITAASYNNVNAGVGKAVTYTVELLNKNYTFGNGTTQTFTAPAADLLKADAPAAEPVSLTVYNSQDKTYAIALPTLPVLPDGCEYGGITYNSMPDVAMSSALSYYTGGAVVENGVLSLPIQAVETDVEGKIGDVAVTVTTDNYEDITLTININAKNKIVPKVVLLTRSEITYGQKLGEVRLWADGVYEPYERGTPKKDRIPIEGTFSWDAPDIIPDVDGTKRYAYTFTPKDTDKYALVKDETIIVVRRREINAAAVTLTGDSFIYNGKAQQPDVVSVKLPEQTLENGATLPEMTLVRDRDYTVSISPGTNAGDYSVTVTGKQNYTGTTTVTWSISPKAVSEPIIELSGDLTYTGTAIEPAVTVKDGETVIPAGEYTVSFSGNTNAGTATVTVTDVEGGNYIVSGSTNFIIAKAASGITTAPKAIKGLAYNGAEQTLVTAGTANGGEMRYSLNGTDWQATIPIGKDAGTYTVYYKVVGDANHLDTVPQSVEVTVGKAAVTVTTKDKSAYVGSKAPVLPAAPVKDADYTISEMFGEDALEGSVTLAYADAPDMSKVGETTIKISGTLTNSNYSVTYVDGKLTISTRPSSGGGGGTVTPPTTTETETTTDPDGTTTKTETKSDGSTVETVTKPDGSTTTTETKTETKPDGSTTTTETKSETNADGTKTETKSETTTAAGGSKTETKSETKTDADGTKTETKAETKTDANGVTSGTETTKTTAPNGSTGTTTTTTENGSTKTEAEAKISEKAVEDAKKSGEAVKVPTEVKAGENSDSAPTVKVELPKDAGETKIEIPVEDVNSGTVAVIVHEDGTEELVKSSAPTEDGIQLVVDGSATIKIVDNSKDFRDTRDHWSRDEVNFVASREIFNGIGNNLFGVGQPMTRGMVNTVLARLAGVDTTPKSGQKWYEVGTEWAKNNGITDGSNPEASVTREQLAAMLYRFSGTPEVSGNLQFNDAREISDYAENALLWAVQNGIMNGVGDERIAPRAEAQRAQVAAMMARYLKNVG